MYTILLLEKKTLIMRNFN